MSARGGLAAGWTERKVLSFCLDHEPRCYNPCMYVCMYGHTYSKIMDQPGKVASPARGHLNRKN